MTNAPHQRQATSRFGAIDADTLARAEAAMASLSGQFRGWLDAELEKLYVARAVIRDEGATIANVGQLYMRAHDLKGLGTTYEYPLISRLAASLCKLIDGFEPCTCAPLPLADAHINAVKAIARDDARGLDHPIAAEVAAALEARVREVIASGEAH